jgi:hypothetical protein
LARWQGGKVAYELLGETQAKIDRYLKDVAQQINERCWTRRASITSTEPSSFLQSQMFPSKFATL